MDPRLTLEAHQTKHSKFLLVLILSTTILNVSMVTLIAGHLQKKNDHRKLSKTWVSKAPRHVPNWK